MLQTHLHLPSPWQKKQPATPYIPTALHFFSFIGVFSMCMVIFKTFCFSPFAGPLASALLQDLKVALSFCKWSPSCVHSISQPGPSFGHWVPVTEPKLQVCFPPRSIAVVALQTPCGIRQVPPPQPSTTVRCCALQVGPVGIHLFKAVARRPDEHVQGVNLCGHGS